MTSSSSTATTTAGTESSTSSTTEAISEATSVEFIPGIDLASVNECDPYVQDCPGGEKCVPYGSTGGNWDAYKCVLVMGDQAVGEACVYGGIVEATDDCDEDGACFDVMLVDGELTGTCHAFCLGAPDDPICPPGSSCLISGSGAVNFCIPNCDPLAQDCGPGLACYWIDSDFACIFTTEDTPLGQPCGFVNDCAEGLSCIAAELVPDCAESACCSTWCDLGGPPEQCDGLAGTECVPYFSDPESTPGGYDHVGICILPEPSP